MWDLELLVDKEKRERLGSFIVTLCCKSVLLTGFIWIYDRLFLEEACSSPSFASAPPDYQGPKSIKDETSVKLT